jgi:hypothetical protein
MRQDPQLARYFTRTIRTIDTGGHLHARSRVNARETGLSRRTAGLIVTMLQPARSGAESGPGSRVRFTPAAQRALTTVSRREGQQAVLVDAEPVPCSRAHPVSTARPAPAADCGGSPTAIASTDPAQALQRELAAQFDGTLSDARIRGYVHDAINDLRGSVSAEALPEMAARLAHHRLSTIENPDDARTA